MTTLSQWSHKAGLAAFALVALLASLAPALLHGHVRPASAHQAAVALVNCDVDTGRLALDAEEQLVLDQTNAYRASYGLPALEPSYALTVTALWKSTDMASRHYGDHDDGFRTWDQRFRDCGYNLPYAYMGENIAGGNASGAATLQQWKDSPHHNENLLSPNFTAVGIKRVWAGAGDQYGWYWSMELGSEMDNDLYAALQGQ